MPSWSWLELPLWGQWFLIGRTRYYSAESLLPVIATIVHDVPVLTQASTREFRMLISEKELLDFVTPL